MVEAVPDSDWQALQNFICYSPWDATALMTQIARDVNALLGGDDDSCLIIDETAFTKKGNQSVGVARQWNGRLGKVDNCQVAVFAALNCRGQVSLVDTRLFLPVSWTDDTPRCQQAGVPEERRDHRQKTELALEMIKSTRANGLSYHWIGADAFYGNDPKLLRQIDQLGEIFLMDVHSDQTIYLADPKPTIPQRQSERGRTPTRLKATISATTVSRWAASQEESNWQAIETRESTTGKIKVQALHRQVWLWDGEEPHAQLWQLIVSRESNSKNNIKYSLSNAPLETPLSRLVYMQGQRYFIERAIEDAKSSAGLADYQVRGWMAWHHHIALVMLAMLFMLITKSNHHDCYELLSCNDIRELLSHFLPKRAITKEEVLRQMSIRHQQRQNAIQYLYSLKKLKSD